MGSNIVDNELILSSAQEITADARSAKKIDLVKAGALGSNMEIWLNFSGLDSGESVKLSAQTSEDDGVQDAYEDKLILPTFTSDPDGVVRIPLNNYIVDERFLALFYDVTLNSGGKITANAHLTLEGHH
jgi:hypothetical protein